MPRPNQYDRFGNVTRDASRLRVPAGLPEDVQAIFEWIVRAADAGHFAPAESPLLVEYCYSLARCAKAEAAVRAEGEVIVVKGEPKPNPWLVILKGARDQVGVLSTKLRLATNARVESKQVKGSGEPVPLVDFTRLRKQP